LKSTTRTTRTWIIAPELLYQVFVAAYYALTAFDLRFGGIALTAFADALERKMYQIV